MVELTIIVPVFNVEKYLEECLNDIVQIKDISMQIICINDASSDSSDFILQKYREQYKIEIYNNEQNKGLAYTRNVGLQHAIGKYVMFVDSDDKVCSSTIGSFIEKMKSDELDLLYFDVEEFGDCNDDTKNRRKRQHAYPIETGLDIFDLMVKNGEMFGCVWDAVYSKEFLSKINLHFINGILHEDIPFTFTALLNALKVGVMLDTGYYYRQRNGSILHQRNYLQRAKGLLVGYAQMLCAWNEISSKVDISKYESSINCYLNSVVSMIETNYLKSGSCDAMDAIVKNFMTNFKIDSNRKLREIIGNKKLDEMRNCKRIAMYGAGKIAKKLLTFLNSEGVTISDIFVTDINDNQDTINGISVIEYRQEYGIACDAIVVAVSEQFQNSIVNRLIELNYQGKIIIFSL